ncbi:hypothetical protein BJ741DRAFT_618083 [Chytriomyces cf. hyalinus JEL632]|nr:hypothetical protein BJ741DRAFT_631507 [Chytriomyces cf. hyalinus JEL632]KAI8831084.1 hypothetical protein BJ741DRAFT_618083 [Chytriomyces cf. hyalinus JEL632]
MSSHHQARIKTHIKQPAKPGTIQEPFRPCTLPFATPFHNQIPLYTPSRHAHDIHEAEALAKLALGTVSNVLLKVSPLAAKVRHYLSSVSLKRREWCSDFCMNPYVGSSGEGLYGKMARDGMTCGGTYIVPPRFCMALMLSIGVYYLQQQTFQHQMASLCRESRPCCSVDTSVLEMLGASDSLTATTEPEPDRIPHWMNPFYATRYENAYYKMQCELQAARTMEQNQIRFQLQQQRQMQHSMQFEFFYQSQQQQQRYVLETGSLHHKRVNADGAASPTPTKKVKLQPTAQNKTKSTDKLASSIHKIETKVEAEDVQPTKLARENNSVEVATPQDEGLSRASSNSGLNSESLVVSLGDGRAVARAAEN